MVLLNMLLCYVAVSVSVLNATFCVFMKKKCAKKFKTVGGSKIMVTFCLMLIFGAPLITGITLTTKNIQVAT